MKTYAVEGVGDVVIRKSKRTKRIILKVNHSGKATVTIPYYVPYKVAELYIHSHTQWLREHTQAKQPKTIYNNMPVGKNHRVLFKSLPQQKPTTRVQNNLITIGVPEDLSFQHPDIQEVARKACERALRKDAEAELPGLLHSQAVLHGYTYREVRIKAVQTRWGSCSNNRIINLSIWLMQLPDHLINYVICHELAHLNHMNHSSAFWQELSSMAPDYKALRKELKQYALLIP
jgi:predicted metal-dependent hydrolase